MEETENVESELADVNHPSAGSISAIDKKSVHRICSGQVVLTLATAVKELLENSIDAGATIIDIKLKDYGSEQIEVSDNGNGVHQKNFEGLTLKHHTSKLQEFSDLINVETFGFRGEALSSLCALSDMSIATRHKDAAVGTRLEYDHNGKILKQSKQARQIGTTVTLQNLFSTLPVRHKEFQRNLKKEFVKMVQVLNSYCIISTGVRITCTNQTGKGSRSTVVSSKGNANMLENISNVFGPKQTQSLLEFKKIDPNEDQCNEFGIKRNNSELFSIAGYVSKCEHGQGRSSTDRQFFFINGRPFDSSKLSKVVNEVYHQYNRHQYPFVVFKISVQKDNVDVNVTPDKRQVFLEGEKIILATVKASLIAMYEPTTSIVQYQLPTSLTCGKNALPAGGSDFTRLSKHQSLEKPTSLTSLMKLKRSFSSAFSKDDSTCDTHSKSPSKSGLGMKQRRLDSFVSSFDSQGRKPKESTSVPVEDKDTNSDVIILDDHKQDTVETSNLDESIVADPAGRTEDAYNSVICKEDIHENTESSRSGLEFAGVGQSPVELPDKTGDHVRDKDIKCLKSKSEFSDRTCLLNSAKDQCVLMSAECVQSDTLCSQSKNKCVQSDTLCSQSKNKCVQSDTLCSQSKNKCVQSDTLCSQSNKECVQKHHAKVQSDQSVHDNTMCVQNDEICVQNSTDYVQGDRKMFDSHSDVCVHEDSCEHSEKDLDKQSSSQDLNVDKLSVEIYKGGNNFENKIVHHHVVEKMDESDPKLNVGVFSHGDAVDNTIEEYIDAEEDVERKEKSINFSMLDLKNRWRQRKKNEDCGRFSRAFRATINPAENQAAEQELQREIKKDMFSQMEILGQFNLGFIITKLEKDLFIVDQHATDEKYNFESLQRDTVIQSQKLICPLNLELTSSNEIILMDNIEIFRKNGFEFSIDEEGQPTQRVKLISTPVSKNWNFGKEDIEEMIFMLTDSPGIMCRPSRVRAMFASRACRKSIMIGTTLNKAEMKKLVCHMGEIEQPWNCPHGRPTMRHLINLDMVPK